MGRQVGLPGFPLPPDNLTRASRGVENSVSDGGPPSTEMVVGFVGGPVQGPLGFPISRRWRFITREVAFFCLLCHEHMEVNLDLSPCPKKRPGE